MMKDIEESESGMEVITTHPGQSPIRVNSGLIESSKKTVVWKIHNLSEVLEEGSKGITFECGHACGIPATWHFYFTQVNQHVLHVLKLSLDSKAKLVEANCSLSVSCEDKILGFANMNSEICNNPPSKDHWKYGYGTGWPLALSKPGLFKKTESGSKVLTVKLVLEVKSTNYTETSEPTIDEAKDVIGDLAKLMESMEDADLEIAVPIEEGLYSRKIHRTILMMRSTVFAKMFGKESEMLEAETGKVVIKDMSPQGLDVLIRYLYTGKVTNQWVNVPMDILNTAEKYNLEGLKKYCGRNLTSALTASNAKELVNLAKLCNLSFALGDIEEFMPMDQSSANEDGEAPELDDNAEEPKLKKRKLM